MNTKILPDFQICISVPLTVNKEELDYINLKKNKDCLLGLKEIME